MMSRPLPSASSAAQAEFVERGRCINCGGAQLAELSRGRFTEEPLAGFIAADPWGESPLPHLQGAEWILVRCEACSQVFHRRVLSNAWNEIRFTKWMSDEAMREFERRAFAKVSRATREFERARTHVAHILRLEKLTRPMRPAGEAVRLLDFGCGWGLFLAACRHFGMDAVGVDRSVPRQENAVVPIVPSVEALAGGPPFHAVTLFEVLEHLDEPGAALLRIAALQEPGGILVLETPDCEGVTAIRTHKDYLQVHPLEHINAFTRDTLTSIAGRHGYEPIERGPAHVTTELRRVARTEARHRLGRDRRSTELYFRKR